VKIQKSVAALIIFLYISVLYFTPHSCLDKPKYFLLAIIRFPLTVTNQVFYELNYILHSRRIVEESVSLYQTVDTLTKQLLQHQEAQAENRRLKELLEFKQNSPLKLIAARIISKDSSNLSDTILIDKGKKHGIKKDATVISEAGLIGRVISDSSDMSRVMLITDPNSKVSAIVDRSRQTGIVTGTPIGICKIIYLPPESDIKIGDKVITSGFSDIFPKGILIGEVIEVAKEKGGLTTQALIKPAADITRIEEVLCIE
jgi:rod shape-determining protein MreC